LKAVQPGTATKRTLLQSRVLIVGGAGAIGQGVSQALRKYGARIMGIDLIGGPEILQADITNDEATRDAVQHILTKFNGLDILINAAGVGFPQDAGAPPDDGVLQTLNINLLGPWRVTSYAMSALIASHGRIINIASGLAFANVPFAAAYSASKRALSAWSDVLRVEYGSHIGITTIYPGYVKTPIHVHAEEAGLSLSGLVREESLNCVVETVVQACIGKPRRDLATTRRGALEIGLARHFPALVDHIILDRMQRFGRRKGYDHAPLASGMLERMRLRK